MIALRSLLLACAVAVTVAGCASGPPRAVDDAVAQQLMADGDFRAAAQEYERLARRNRANRDDLTLRAAEALREEGDWTGVLATIQRIKRYRLAPRDAARLDMLLAEAALADGDAQGALDLASVSSGIDPRLEERSLEIQARALAQLDRPLEGAKVRLALNAKLSAEDRAANEAELLETLAAIPVSTLQKGLGALAPRDPLRPWMERALRLRGAVPARSVIKPTRQAGTLMPGDADRPWRREGYAATPRVALLLPATGTLAPVGRAVRDGFMTAYFAETGERPQVRVFDSGETRQSAVAAYRKAVADGSARVVGPLTRDQVQAIFESGDVRVPLLALNHPDSGSPPPQGSQQFGLLPDEEAAYAAERALERGITRAAILAGMEEWSERAALAFRAQFEQQGGVIVGEARLPGESVDFSSAIAQAAGAGGAGVVFIAVRPQQGRLLVPQLRSRGLDRTPLFATSHIYGGAPNRGLDRDLNGVEFCDAPWLFGLAAGLPSRDSLARRLPTAAANGRLFAFGMDAFRLLPYLDWLSSNTDAYLAGASGQLAIDDFGRVRRLPSWLRFVDGVPQSAEGFIAPETAAGSSAPGAP